MGFGCPGIVVKSNDDESLPPDFFDGLTCKFHKITKNENNWIHNTMNYQVELIYLGSRDHEKST